MAAVSVDLTGSQRGLQLPEFIFAQLDVPYPEVFQNTVLILGTGDQNNVRVFMQHFEHRVFTGVFRGVQISVRSVRVKESRSDLFTYLHFYACLLRKMEYNIVRVN